VKSRGGWGSDQNMNSAKASSRFLWWVRGLGSASMGDGGDREDMSQVMDGWLEHANGVIEILRPHPEGEDMDKESVPISGLLDLQLGGAGAFVGQRDRRAEACSQRRSDPNCFITVSSSNCFTTISSLEFLLCSARRPAIGRRLSRSELGGRRTGDPPNSAGAGGGVGWSAAGGGGDSCRGEERGFRVRFTFHSR
jgi:hypothetical protein